MLLTDIRTGVQDCHERVVFDFSDEAGSDDGSISYIIDYASPPFVGLADEPFDVDGTAFLEILFFSASAFDFIDGMPSYTGPDEIKPADLESVAELQLVEDFEALLVWVIGLDQPRAFEVFQLDDPDRFVLDIGPPAPG